MGKHLQKKHHTRKIEEDIKQVNWLIDVLKSILTGFVLLLLSTFVIWIIAHNSPGEFTGEKLENYLLKTISHELRKEKHVDDLAIEIQYQDEEKIVVFGNYITEAQSENQKVPFSVFERKSRNFWNDLVRTSPAYKPVFLLVSENGFTPNTFQCLNCKNFDLDENGTEEIYLEYKCHYGNYSPIIHVFLQKYQGSWHVCFPDLSSLQQEIAAEGGSPKWLEVNEYSFIDPRKKDSVPVYLYGLWGDSFLHQVENPFWGGTDFLCGIRAVEDIPDSEFDYRFAVIVDRITDHGVFRDHNWNMGDLLYTPQDGFDLDAICAPKWGGRVGEDSQLALYAADVG